MKKAIERKINRPQPMNNHSPGITAYLPYIQGVTDKIARILSKKEIKTTFRPPETIKQKMRSVKDNLDHRKYKGVYKIECSCRKCYIGETSHSFQVRIKEHGADIKNERICTSVLEEHSLKTKHHVRLEDTKILAKEGHLFERQIREAIEIRKHPSNLNRDKGLELNDNWFPLIHKK